MGLKPLHEAQMGIISSPDDQSRIKLEIEYQSTHRSKAMLPSCFYSPRFAEKREISDVIKSFYAQLS